jgi:hypothetical protein
MYEPNPDGRHLNGRFARGNKVSRGNIGNKRMGELRRAVLDSVSPQDAVNVMKCLYDMAIAGDVQAARVWLDHVLGKPPQAVEVSGPPEGARIGISVVIATLMDALKDEDSARIKVGAAFGRLSELARNGAPQFESGDRPGALDA